MRRFSRLLALALTLSCKLCVAYDSGDRVWHCDTEFTAYDGLPHVVCASLNPETYGWEIYVVR